MLQLIDPNRGIPYRQYVFPETGFVVEGVGFSSIVSKAMKHAKGNNIDTEGLVARIEDYLCRKNPPEYCVTVGDPRAPAAIPISTGCGGCPGKKAK